MNKLFYFVFGFVLFVMTGSALSQPKDSTFRQNAAQRDIGHRSSPVARPYTPARFAPPERNINHVEQNRVYVGARYCPPGAPIIAYSNYSTRYYNYPPCYNYPPYNYYARPIRPVYVINQPPVVYYPSPVYVEIPPPQVVYLPPPVVCEPSYYFVFWPQCPSVQFSFSLHR
jgi:hypothetical protein